jgi:hypothetical protein
MQKRHRNEPNENQMADLARGESFAILLLDVFAKAGDGYWSGFFLQRGTKWFWIYPSTCAC